VTALPFRHPELEPPPGWTSFVIGSQVRWIPPGTTRDDARAAIIVSPLVPRRMVPVSPEQLVLKAIEAEERQGLKLSARQGPRAAQTRGGLAGVVFEVTGTARRSGKVERRVYAVYADASWLYGINYLADEESYDEHLAAFWEAAGSIVPLPPLPAPADGGPMAHYGG
jgi:hypothetical protein